MPANNPVTFHGDIKSLKELVKEVEKFRRLYHD